MPIIRWIICLPLLGVGVSILTRGEGVVANFNKIREMMLLCFFTGWRNPLGDEEEVK